MPVRNTKRLIVAIACCCWFDPAVADFVVKDVQANLIQRELHVSTKIDLDLSEQAERAVENGVPLVVLTEFELMRDGVFWNNTLTRYRNGQRLRYHSLSDRYVVENLDVEDMESYESVAEALESMGGLRSLVFTVPDTVSADMSEYTLAVRSRLDINELPAPLRPLAFFSPAWQMSSEWSTWQIKNP